MGLADRVVGRILSKAPAVHDHEHHRAIFLHSDPLTIASSGLCKKFLTEEFRWIVDFTSVRLRHSRQSGCALCDGKAPACRGGPASSDVVAGLVPAISIVVTLCPQMRGRRDKPGDDTCA